MEEKNKTGGYSENPREFSSIIKGIFIFFMLTSGFNGITKFAINLMMGNTSLGIIMFICEMSNIYFLYVILQKKSWGLIAFFGMMLLQIPLNIFLECPDMDKIYISIFLRMLVFSLILLIPKNKITGWAILFGKEKHLNDNKNSNTKTMLKIFSILIIAFVVVCCLFQIKKEEMHDSQFANQKKNLVKYDNFGVSFDYPDDYTLEEKVLEDGNYFKVYLEKEDEITFQSIQIEWRNNPQKYDPIAGRQGLTNELRRTSSGNIRILREYESILGEEIVYCADYVLKQEGENIYLKQGVTKIDDYVFVIQIISNIDVDNEEANKIFKSIRLTK